MKPTYAVISCSEDNSYGHPHAETLNTLRKNGVKVYRTDEEGTIIATADGKKITFNVPASETWKAGEPPQNSTTSDTSQSTKNKTTTTQKADDSAKGTGDSAENEQNTSNDTSAAVQEPQKDTAPSQPAGITYVLNKNTHKFHVPGCSSVDTIKPKNREDTTMSRDEVIAAGYVPCKRCNP